MKDISKIVADVESTLAPYFKEIEETADNGKSRKSIKCISSCQSNRK
ncbi:hypothetical protein ACVNPZ_12260 [Staphylococcus aureus]